MISLSRVFNHARPVCRLGASYPVLHRHGLLTLAIETSCDDTSVAIIEKPDLYANDGEGIKRRKKGKAAILHFHETWTANSLAYKGIHPVVALEHHQSALPGLVEKAIASLPVESIEDGAQAQEIDNFNSPVATRGTRVNQRRPDFVTVTRGPGMRSNLFTGLDVAKGLAVAWQVPLVGVNHMQAHALTPRLVSALNANCNDPPSPSFPFLSLLVSGGHTMLIHSKSLCDHPTLATTVDIAVGDAIDKIARTVLPGEVLESSQTTSYGPLLEKFAFPDAKYGYTPPQTRKEELYPEPTRWGWKLGVPLATTKAGSKTNSMEFSYSGLCSSAADVIRNSARVLSMDERRDLAKEAMRVAFEHLASRVVLALQSMSQSKLDGSSNLLAGDHGPPVESSDFRSSNNPVKTMVVSGGVAANQYLRHILRKYLDHKGFSHISLTFPPIQLCTDNAAMIGWTGLEMFEAGWSSDLSCRALRKWSLDPSNLIDGGILGVDGWKRNSYCKEVHENDALDSHFDSHQI